MKIFNYDKSAPCPTDKEVLLIKKRFQEFLAESANVWCKGVINQLMMYREYADLETVRMVVRKGKFGPVPVITLRPVVADETEATIEHYMEFFSLYEHFREQMLKATRKNLFAPRTAPRDTTDVILYSNLIKLLIKAMNMGVFNSLDFEAAKLRPHDDDTQALLRKLGEACVVVGPKFIEGGSIVSEVDSDLIGAFYRYVAKQTRRALESWTTDAEKTTQAWTICGTALPDED